ncbi:MAG: chemotaxis protein CheW [Candidatus Methylomirabilales bacterium]
MAVHRQLVGFRIGKEYFGVDIAQVQEIIRVQEVTPVPEAPWFVEGVINLRGRIVPVIDFRKWLKLGVVERTRLSRILIVELDRRPVGLLVDAASEILKLPQEAVEPPPELISGIGTAYITGVGKWGDRLIILLDLGKIFNPEEAKKLEAGEGIR